MKANMMKNRSISIQCITGLLAGACLALPLAVCAKADEPALASVAQRHGECLGSSFKTGSTVASQDVGGYGIEVQGERYWVALEGRLTFSLLQVGGGDAVAQVKLDRPPSADFDEQARWRERWLEDVAARSGVTLERRALPENAQLLTLNKKTLSGRFLGLSLLVDPQRKLFVQWDWNKLARYTDPRDLLTTQKAVWEALIPCALKAH